MPIHDVGYRRWDGELDRFWPRWLVIAGAGIKMVWKSHWLRRMLLLSWLPAAYFGFAFFAYEQALERPIGKPTLLLVIQRLPHSDSVLQAYEEDPESARHEVWSLLLMTFFRYPQGTLMVIVVGLIAPALISQDFRSRAFLLYFSKPLTPLEYITGKAMVLWVYLSAITTLPALSLYVLGVLLSPDLSVVATTWDLPLRILAASLVLMVPTTCLALFLSSMTTESRYAGFAWFAVWGLGWVAASQLMTIGAGDRWSIVSIYHMLGRVQAWVFGLHVNVDEITSAAVFLVFLSSISFVVLLSRVYAPMRI